RSGQHRRLKCDSKVSEILLRKKNSNSMGTSRRGSPARRGRGRSLPIGYCATTFSLVIRDDEQRFVYQVSDITIRSRHLRRVALAHAAVFSERQHPEVAIS